MKTIILLLLMTSVCWADKYMATPIGDPTVIIYEESGKFPKSNITYQGKYPNGTLKMSCPDGYRLEGKLFNRNGVTRIGKFDSNQTDAELTCVKNN